MSHKKFYAPTPKLARIHGRDPKRYSRPPGELAIAQRLLSAIFCMKTGVRFLTPQEFAERFPRQAACKGLCPTKYFVDTTKQQPLLSVLLPSYGHSVRRTARKARKAIAKRKEHDAWLDLIYFNLFQVVLVSVFESKAADLRYALRRDTFPKSIVVIPELADLLNIGDRT